MMPTKRGFCEEQIGSSSAHKPGGILSVRIEEALAAGDGQLL